MYPETIKHIFWECDITKYFLDCFNTLLHDNFGLENIVFDAESIMFGNPNFDNILNVLVLLGKR